MHVDLESIFLITGHSPSGQLRGVVGGQGGVGAEELVAIGVDEDVVGRVVGASTKLLERGKGVGGVAVLEKGAAVSEVETEALAGAAFFFVFGTGPAEPAGPEEDEQGEFHGGEASEERV